MSHCIIHIEGTCFTSRQDSLHGLCGTASDKGAKLTPPMRAEADKFC